MIPDPQPVVYLSSPHQEKEQEKKRSLTDEARKEKTPLITTQHLYLPFSLPFPTNPQSPPRLPRVQWRNRPVHLLDPGLSHLGLPPLAITGRVQTMVMATDSETDQHGTLSDLETGIWAGFRRGDEAAEEDLFSGCCQWCWCCGHHGLFSLSGWRLEERHQR